jgi:hypothetical protein
MASTDNCTSYVPSLSLFCKNQGKLLRWQCCVCACVRVRWTSELLDQASRNPVMCIMMAPEPKSKSHYDFGFEMGSGAIMIHITGFLEDWSRSSEVHLKHTHTHTSISYALRIYLLSVCMGVYPLSFLSNGSAKTATNTNVTLGDCSTGFSMRSMSYQIKVGEQFLP